MAKNEWKTLDTGLFPRGELNYPDGPNHTSLHKMDPNESKDKEPEFLVPLTHRTPLGLKEMCGNRNLGVQGNSTTLLKRLRDWSHNEW
ncbi:hypothetical protein PROFUN_16877, partial [Planoprotostelium fungivorum]